MTTVGGDEGSDSIEFSGVSVRKEMLAAWIFRLILFVAVVWVSDNFVSKKTYETDKAKAEEGRTAILGEMQKTNNTLIRIDEKMTRDLARDKELEDHEARIREIEKHLRNEPAK